MKILTTTTIEFSKKVFTADWIVGYDDGMSLSSTTLEFDSEEERRKELEKDYEKDDIDIDTDNHDYGWEFGNKTVTGTITVEVIENDDGKIVVRQKK